MIMYHLTPAKNVDKILKKGLVPGKARGLTEVLRKHPGDIPHLLRHEKSFLYLLEDLESVGDIVAQLSYLVKSPKKYTILKVDVPGNIEVDTDTDWRGEPQGILGGFKLTKGRIPGRNIEVMGHVVVRPRREPTIVLGSSAEKEVRLGITSSEIVSQLEEPESQEALVRAREEYEQLPSSSRARQVVSPWLLEDLEEDEE